MTGITATAARATPLTPDLCIIGGGSSGLALATAAALFGVPTVLIERDRLGGGKGGLVTRALVSASARLRALGQAERFGLAAGTEPPDFAKVQAHVASVLAAIAPNETLERLSALGVTVLKAEARFIDRNTVQAGEQPIKARRFVIATGARPSAPAIQGLDTVPVLTAEMLATLNRRPERLIVLGDGASALELAQAMRQLGSTVTLVATQGLLSSEDPEAVMLLRRALLRDGIGLHENARILRAEALRHRVRLFLAGAESGEELALEGTHLLVATAGTAEIEALDLELAGISGDGRGVIAANGLRTQNRRVFAIGACAGGANPADQPQLAQLQASLVLRNALFRLPIRQGDFAVPRSVACDPQLASVGLSEEEARKSAADIRILRWPYAETERARLEHRTEGFIKLIANAKGRILGVTILGAAADELIVPWCLAIQKGLTVGQMANLVPPAASFSDLSKRAALSFHAPLATQPRLRRLIGFLRRFG